MCCECTLVLWLFLAAALVSSLNAASRGALRLPSGDGAAQAPLRAVTVSVLCVLCALPARSYYRLATSEER